MESKKTITERERRKKLKEKCWVVHVSNISYQLCIIMFSRVYENRVYAWIRGMILITMRIVPIKVGVPIVIMIQRVPGVTQQTVIVLG